MTTKAPHFLEGLDRDLRQNLVKALRENWTHHSTGLEGNSLTLGETAYVLAEGLTVDGKPIKDHREVIGHGKAVDWVIEFAASDKLITEQDIFALHRLIQTEDVADIYKPMGGWKVEPNGSYGRDKFSKPKFYDFADPTEVPPLMETWMAQLNSALQQLPDADCGALTFANLHNGFTLIHPFWDGNGRMVRILANLPLLRAGLPPIVIRRDESTRAAYIGLLQELHSECGVPVATNSGALSVGMMLLEPLAEFCRAQWSESLELVELAHAQQQKRRDR